MTEPTVGITCTDRGQHGPRLLAELAVRGGEVVDLRQAGFQTLRKALMAQHGAVADFDRRCRTCGKNPRATTARLAEIFRIILDTSASSGRVVYDVSRDALRLF